MGNKVSKEFGEFLETRTDEQKERLHALADKAQAAMDEYVSFRLDLEREWAENGGKEATDWNRMDHFAVTVLENDEDIGHRISALSDAELVQQTTRAFVDSRLSDGDKMRLLAGPDIAPLMVLEMSRLADTLVTKTLVSAKKIQMLAQLPGKTAEALPVEGNA